MATATRRKKTVDDYMRLPDETRVELFEGEFFMSPSPGYKHQKIVVKLVRALTDIVESQKLGEVLCAPFDVILSDEDVVQPDVLFISSAKLANIRERLYGPPDLAVEVLSPANAERDRIVKRDLYLKYGVREYWIVDPEARTVEVLASANGAWRLHAIFTEADELTSPVLPDLHLSLRELFA